jgi:hypothetical protein
MPCKSILLVSVYFYFFYFGMVGDKIRPWNYAADHPFILSVFLLFFYWGSVGVERSDLGTVRCPRCPVTSSFLFLFPSDIDTPHSVLWQRVIQLQSGHWHSDQAG